LLALLQVVLIPVLTLFTVAIHVAAASYNRDQCRRDDLFSLLYVFIDLLKGSLPWSGAAGKFRPKDEVARLKKAYMDEPFTDNMMLNINISCMRKYLTELGWTDTPDYELLRSHLLKMKQATLEAAAAAVVTPAFSPMSDSTSTATTTAAGTSTAATDTTTTAAADAGATTAVVSGFLWDPPEHQAVGAGELDRRTLLQRLQDLQKVESTMPELDKCKAWCLAAKEVLVGKDKKKGSSKEVSFSYRVLLMFSSSCTGQWCAVPIVVVTIGVLV
jgi:hypothetical protein